MQEYDSLRINLDLKEKELSAWEEKLNAKEKVCSYIVISLMFALGNYDNGWSMFLFKLLNFIDLFFLCLLATLGHSKVSSGSVYVSE